ncbi:MAG: hypothetical protein K2W96_19790 [Gemmataceae bacterium]|nr:hypothetical protein [Gemmataceae bacterium]
MSRWMLAGALALAAGAVLAEGPADLIKTLGAVGPEGKGHEEAAAAWKKLAASDASVLVPILAAMQDEELRSANWLRSAFLAVAERAHEAGKLPKADLEAFVKDAKKPRAARRLAYEWLAKADPTAPERLLPGMTRDPSPELRRDAVARLIKAAEKADKVEDWQAALAGATDPDQVDGIAKRLEKLGVKADLPKHFGFVTRWRLVGPFENVRNIGWDTAYPPEKKIDLSATHEGKDGAEAKWIAHETKDPHGLVDLNKALKKHKGAVAYAYAEVESPKDQEAWLRAGCITSIKMWVNGKLAFARDEYHHGMSMDQHVGKAALKKGKNTILLKVCQNEQKEPWAQDWMFQLRLSDFAGSAVEFKQEGKR